MLIHSEESLNVRILTNLAPLYKQNNNRELNVSFLNTCAYTFSTFGWTQKLMKHITV